MSNQVSVWIDTIVIPTYPIGSPEKNPMFLEKRVYQGSSGVVYPHAVVEKIYDNKIDKHYKAVFLENEYIKIMVLPELGGRIQMAYDKVKERHFIYYNQVIKPALVGLTGPWISGGIEFNWPQHHRPSTFDPVDFTFEEHPDGSKTIWINEVERMFRTKGLAGFTLYPGKAFIEIKGRLYNRTPFPQTFLWWANPAVKVNDHYQSIFPPDVYAVFDHGKRDVSSFPVATGVYYKVDYSPGTDISRYKNIPVPTSYMAISSRYNFIGGYEHDTHGGLLHVADHHISPGKKQWTWGHSDFGKAWDKNLTDEDGPYIELMTGVFTDNQPDFSWLQPYEEKTFTQYFMPYQEVGVVKNATKSAVVGVEYKNRTAEIKLYVTSAYDNLRIDLKHNNTGVFSEVICASPAKPYIKVLTLPGVFSPDEILLLVTDVATKEILVSYKQEKRGEQEIPLAAQPAKLPRDVENNEQLYLTGLHLEQYRHATYNAADYYEEALRRDGNDVRSNNALGLWYLRKGKFPKAETFLRRAIHSLTRRNPNPYDGEPFYNLGCCLKMQGKSDEAFDAFYKATWNDAWQHAAFLNLAQIACAKGNLNESLELIDKSLVKNYHSHTARHLKVVLLRKFGRIEDAQLLITESLGIDPFNFGCMFEKHLLLGAIDEAAAQEAVNILKDLSRNWEHNFIEYALDYAHAGLFDEAVVLLQVQLSGSKNHYPMMYYYLGWFSCRQGLIQQAMEFYLKAAALPTDYCFPNRVEDVAVLQEAMLFNKEDYKAPYYLGNFWYDKRQYPDAISCWEVSEKIDGSFPTVHRNLSLACYNKLKDPQRALSSMEKAFRLDASDARVLMELDQLYKRLNSPFMQRLTLLEGHLSLVESRDDLLLERITLYNQLGDYNSAKNLLGSARFHPWEGGEGKVIRQYLVCNIELAKFALVNDKSQEALLLLQEAEDYPDHLGEGKLFGMQENDIHYLKGLAYEQQGETNMARQCFAKATCGTTEPVQAVFYNDAHPDKILYQGFAWQKLGDKEKALEIFRKLIDFGESHWEDTITLDYFAVSLPDLLVFDVDLHLMNKIHCTYLMALGYMGLGKENFSKADELFNQVLMLDLNHQGSSIHKNMLLYPGMFNSSRNLEKNPLIV